MPAVMTVNWQHVLLDPKVFEDNGTFRVARVRGRLGAFPVKASGHWESNVRYWTPALSPEAGYAPETYEYEGRVFNLGFWTYKEFRNEVLDGGRSSDSNHFTVTTTANVIVRVEATAIYYWNFGDGGGGHAVYIDAFDETNQEFMSDDFVDILPDEPPEYPLTAEANNGRLMTETIESVIIRARPVLRVFHEFSMWTNEQDLSRIDMGRTRPVIAGSDIRVRSGSVIAAVAHYVVNTSRAVPVQVPREGGLIIGNPSDGPFIFWPVGGSPTPVGPWDPTVLFAMMSAGQIAQLQGQIAAMQKRIESLEKQQR